MRIGVHKKGQSSTFHLDGFSQDNRTGCLAIKRTRPTSTSPPPGKKCSSAQPPTKQCGSAFHGRHPKRAAVTDSIHTPSRANSQTTSKPFFSRAIGKGKIEEELPNATIPMVLSTELKFPALGPHLEATGGQSLGPVDPVELCDRLSCLERVNQNYLDTSSTAVLPCEETTPTTQLGATTSNFFARLDLLAHAPGDDSRCNNNPSKIV